MTISDLFPETNFRNNAANTKSFERENILFLYGKKNFFKRSSGRKILKFTPCFQIFLWNRFEELYQNFFSTDEGFPFRFSWEKVGINNFNRIFRFELLGEVEH